MKGLVRPCLDTALSLQWAFLWVNHLRQDHMRPRNGFVCLFCTKEIQGTNRMKYHEGPVCSGESFWEMNHSLDTQWNKSNTFQMCLFAWIISSLVLHPHLLGLLLPFSFLCVLYYFRCLYSSRRHPLSPVPPPSTTSSFSTPRLLGHIVYTGHLFLTSRFLDTMQDNS